MRMSKFTDDRIAFALKQTELGIGVEEVCRNMGISEATSYVSQEVRWRRSVRAAAAAPTRGREPQVAADRGRAIATSHAVATRRR